MKYKIIFFLFGIMILLLAGSKIFERLCDVERVSVFNWDRDMVTAGSADLFFDEVSGKCIRTVYQYIPVRTADEDIAYYLKSAAAHEVDVYLLTGEPDWGLEADGESMISEIARAQAMNQLVPEHAQLKGIVMDVEPYLTGQWDSTPKKVMDSFAAGLTCAYNEALESGLAFIVCIPYYYDTKGFIDELEVIIDRGSDSVAVMNYYKGKEEEHIAEEIALSEKYGKKLINIYELQPPEGSAIIDANTYYHDGLGAVIRSAVRLKSVYKGNIGFAIHDYDAWKEIMENE